ncbi:MAG: hypothetical protein WD294_13300 [Phycisphaeraceae bacterium]
MHLKLLTLLAVLGVSTLGMIACEQESPNTPGGEQPPAYEPGEPGTQPGEPTDPTEPTEPGEPTQPPQP